MWGENPFNLGLELLQLRAEVGAAQDAAKTAATTAAQLGTAASGELQNTQPIFQKEENAEHAYDPTQIDEMLTAAGAGTGAATGAADAQLKRQAAATGNAAGQTKSLQELARDRQKAAAGNAEGVAAQDVQGALALRQAGLAGEQGLYGENLKGQLAAMGQQSSDINAATQASQTGWLQQGEGLVNTGENIASKIPGSPLYQPPT